MSSKTYFNIHTHTMYSNLRLLDCGVENFFRLNTNLLRQTIDRIARDRAGAFIRL